MSDNRPTTRQAFIRKGASVIRNAAPMASAPWREAHDGRITVECPSCFSVVPVASTWESIRIVDGDGEGYAVCQWCHEREMRKTRRVKEWE